LCLRTPKRRSPRGEGEAIKVGAISFDVLEPGAGHVDALEDAEDYAAFEMAIAAD
jgi:hypothetical protein